MNEFQHSKEQSEVNSMYQWLKNQSINQSRPANAHTYKQHLYRRSAKHFIATGQNRQPGFDGMKW
jgi:hypothetical protein